MQKITSLKQLEALRNNIAPRFETRHNDRFATNADEIVIRVCMGSSCVGSGSAKVKEALEKTIAADEKLKRIKVVETVRTGCHGLCAMGPILIISPGDILYTKVQVEDVPEIIEKHIKHGQLVERLLFHDVATGKAIANYAQIPFYLNSERRILKYNGLIDPWSIEEYIGLGGYEALGRVLFQMTPDQVINEVKLSGLRGRGGAGFPTATKWGFVRNAASDIKYVVCNGDEGDPGAYMNRSVLEGSPHSVIEGMIIGAYAIGNVKEGFAYVRAEYPLAIETLSHAISQAREYGLLGKNIFGTDFEFSIDIFPGAGAFVCGEETALLISIEGKRGNPRQRPPFPANPGGGLFGKPTTINNVETWANIPQIITNGADWFNAVGSEKAKGTKTLCLVGKVNNPGLVEVPLGTPLGKIIFDIGGGCGKGKKFKAVQLGGPSGGVIPLHYINTPIDYESISSLGAIMGSGGIVVMDEDSCMVDVAKFFLQFTKEESCGKCTSCRAGIPQMLAMLDKISFGTATLEDLDKLTELAEMITSTSLCGLGQTSANPVLTTMRHFREEYEAHIIDKKCPAAVCRALFKAPCQHSCPVQLDVPGYVSLIKEGKFAEAYTLIKQRNPLPAVCGRVCHHPCERRCNRSRVDESVAIRELKRFAADYAFNSNLKIKQPVKIQRAEKVAIIGAGPAGLAAAWDLAMEGYGVTIYESLPVAGGMLAVAIPEYRMPRDILQKEIDEIKELGVEIKLNSRIDDAASLLKEGYNAVFIATGAHIGIKMGIPGEALTGVYDAIEFLRKINLGQPVTLGKRVAVIGGGNSAVDSARVAVRKGSEVHLIYRRERDDMPAMGEEVKAAEEEGVIFHFLTNPVKILGGKNVERLVLARMELGEFDRTGRKAARPAAGPEIELEVDTVIEAIGQRPDTSIVKGDGMINGSALNSDVRTLATVQPGIFAGGDAVYMPHTVVEAMEQGQRAASSIKRYLRGEPFSPRISRDIPETIAIPQTPPTDTEMKEKARLIQAEIPLPDRIASFKEVTLPFTPEQARQEATRCLRCDLDVGG